MNGRAMVARRWPTAAAAVFAIAAVFAAAGSIARAPAAASTSPAATTPASAAVVLPAQYPTVVAGRPIEFPADEGSHPAYRTEWWYVTGWLETADGAPLGFQVTFFRIRPTLDTANPSRFAARQVIIAHAAVSDPARGRLWHDQRIAREGFGLAQVAVGTTDVSVRDWRLTARDGAFLAAVRAEDFAYELRLERTQPPLVNGVAGYSRKGPRPESASWYYSLPHLRVSGTLARAGRSVAVTGEAWLDHEWSSEYLDADAVGWDWVGLNLADGGALMAFRIRDRTGAVRWAGGTLRDAAGSTRALAPGDVAFTPGRRWRSPRTGLEFPVEWRLRAGEREFALTPLLDDQESDSRLTTGAVYWEGAVRVGEGGRPAGRGYLELTGYGEPLRLR